jgi:hypothetical protein
MRNLMVVLAGATCLAAITPAVAQSGSQPNFQNRFGNLETRIQAGLQSGAITRTEAAPLREQLRQVQQLERRYAPGGFTPAERNRLQTRLQSLRQQIATAERNDYARPGTSDDDPWPGDEDARRDRYDDRDQDRSARRDDRDGYDDRYPDGYDDQASDQAPYEVRVGSRVPSHFGGIPRELRNEFPETMPYTYRFSDDRVYQVDRRTGVIVRIYEPDRR